MPVILRTTTVKLKENLYVGDGKYASVAYEHKPGRRLVSGGGVRRRRSAVRNPAG